MEPLSLSSSSRTASLSPTLSSSIRDRAQAFVQPAASNTLNLGLGLGLPSGPSAPAGRPTQLGQPGELDDVRITSPQELTQFVRRSTRACASSC